MFILDTLTTVRVLDVRVLSQKDRKPDEQPGAQLLLQATLGVGVLAQFDGFLPGMLYRKPQVRKQGELDGIESAELTSVGEHVKRLPWAYEQTGCEIVIDLGMGGRSNIVLSDVKVHRVSLRPEQKGVVIQWTADAPGLNDTTRGKLTGLKSTDIKMTMAGPEVEDGQGEIEGTKPKPASRAEKPAATTAEASKQALDASGKSPFPAAPPKTDDQVREEALQAAAAAPVARRSKASAGAAVE